MIIRKANPGGFTVIEILVVLMILGMLLASMAVAFHASSMSYRQNEEMYRAMATARGALLRITTDIRTADAVAVSEPAGQCSMITAGGGDITYLHNSGDNTLYLVDNATSTNHVLCNDVTSITFTRAAVPGDPGKIRNVQISMTVTAGSNPQTISTAAVLKKNL